MDEGERSAADLASAAASKDLPVGLFYAFGPFELSAERQLLTHNGRQVRIGSRAMAVLTALVERPGELMSKEELLARVWPETFVEEGTLRVHITALRRALQDSSDAPQYILNVSGRGYQFVAPVQRTRPAGIAVRSGMDDVAAAEAAIDTLPIHLSNIIGRDDALADIAATLGQSRLVTIAGTGGIGKTTVALAVAHRLKRKFEGGAYFIDLAAVTDPAFVPYAVAATARVGIEADRPVESLVARLKHMEVLLLFDNCEHVIDQAAAVAESLLRGARGIRVLATSHEPLRAQGERVYRLAPFDLEPDAEFLTLAAALRNPAVQLFVEHATANDDTTCLTDDDVPFIVEICRRLDGLPLAIEIAAARAGSLGVEELASRLDDRFRLLTGGRRTAAARHQTLRNMLDWSHDNLGARERTVLRRLSVFAGAFTLEGACMVAGDEKLGEASITDAVSSLVGKSLLMPGSSAGTSAYRLLDSTRLYALEKLALAGEVPRIRRLHAQYMCDLLQRAEGEWNDLPRQLWQERYGPTIDDVRSVIAWAFSDEGDPIPGVLLTSLAMPLALQRGLVTEFWTRGQVAITRARALAAPLLLPEMRLNIGCGYFGFVQDLHYEPFLYRATEIAEQIGTDRARIEPLVVRGAISMSSGFYERSLTECEAAAELGRGIDDDLAVLSASRVMAQSQHFVGNHLAAIDLAQAVIRHPVAQIPVTYGFVHTDRRVSMRVVLAQSLWISGNGDRAVKVAEEAMAIASDAGPMAVCQALAYGLGPIHLWRGEDEIAAPYMAHLREEASRYAVTQWLNWAEVLDATLAARRGEPLTITPPMEHYGQMLLSLVGIAAPIPDLIEERRWCGPELVRLKGEALLAKGQLEAGEAEILRAREQARKRGAIAWELRCAISIGRLWQGGPRQGEAAAMLADVLARLPEGHQTADPMAAKGLLSQLALGAGLKSFQLAAVVAAEDLDDSGPR